MKRHKKKPSPESHVANEAADAERNPSLLLWCFNPGQWTLCQRLAILALLCFAAAILMNGAVDTGIAQFLAVCAYACLGVCWGVQTYRNLTADKRAQAQ